MPQDKDKNTSDNQQNEKKKSLFEMAREIDEREKQKELLDQQILNQKIADAEKKQKADYQNKLRQERLELLRMKQGFVDEESSDIIKPVAPPQTDYTLTQKISNFFYHSKWWLGIAFFCFGLIVFLVYDYVTTVRPDMSVMLVSHSQEFYKSSPELSELIAQYVPDINEDGEVKVAVYYIPISDYLRSNDTEMLTANQTKLTAEFQSGSVIMVIADSESVDDIMPDSNFVNMEEIFPDDENARKYGYYLSDTNLAEKIGFEGDIPDDVYIALRRVKKTFSAEEKMQQNYDVALDALKHLVEEIN